MTMPAFDPASYGDCTAAFYDQLYPVVETGLVTTLAELAQGGPALDLGIGTGRVAVPLRRAGVPVVGIEASSSMIAAFHSRPCTQGIPVIRGDFATDPLGDSPYRLIYALVSTFFLLPTELLQQACFHNVARHLAPGGHFVSEAFLNDGSFPVPEVTEVPITTPSGVFSYRVMTLSTPLVLIDEMACRSGLRLVERWSHWSRKPYQAGQPRHISVYAREG
ncbi:MAG: class I SAM-dependent methyltransferase [Geminicoccaceae bacterium]